jgi:hypothetical protein
MATLATGEIARMYALGGIARGGATRGGYVSSAVFITIGGVQVGTIRDSPSGTSRHFGTLVDSLSISDTLNETPNTATFRIAGWVPPQGAEVVMTMGSVNRIARLFAGFALTVRQLYVGDDPRNVQAEVRAVDYTWQLGFTHVTGRYTNQPASAIAADLVTRYAAVNGFTGKAIAANLPVVDDITYTEEDLPAALTRLCDRVGAYWSVDYHRDVHLFINETLNGDPVALTPSHPSLADVEREGDRTQVLTRVFVEGRGTRITAPVGVGETAIPVEAVDMFEAAADVFLKVSFQGSDGGAQYLDFSGVVAATGGALVGSGAMPSAAPTLALATAGSIEVGAHGYAVSFVTAAGESLPGPTATIAPGTITPPPSPYNVVAQPTGSGTAQSSFTIGDTVYFWATYVAGDGSPGNPYRETNTSGSSSQGALVVSNNDNLNPTASAPFGFTVTGSSNPSVTYIRIYVQSVQRGNTTLHQQVTNYTGQPVHITTAGGGYGTAGTAPPSANGTGQRGVALTGIPIGAAAVTARKIYRTAANGSALKLLTTIANNTASTYSDTASDATLGAAPPASDTSGLAQPTGQVPAGSTSLVVASTGAFRALGGWAVIGNGDQTIRYSGISGGALTGIPATGLGSITAAIGFNSTVTPSPMLTGIPASGTGSIQRALTPGDELYFVVFQDAGDATAALKAAVGGNGVREQWVQDRRLSAAEARARAAATLATHPLDQWTLTYRCRDLRTASGKTITVNLPAPTNISGTFRAQQVTIGNFRVRPNQYPTFTVSASSQRFSFADWLRILKTET